MDFKRYRSTSAIQGGLEECQGHNGVCNVFVISTVKKVAGAWQANPDWAITQASM